MSPALTPSASPELCAPERRLELGRLLDTWPERAVLAGQHELGHLEFVEAWFGGEVTRRDSSAAVLRSGTAHPDPSTVLEAWDETANVTFGKAEWSELVTLRFVEQAQNPLFLGPVGVGKTFLATAPGHVARR